MSRSIPPPVVNLPSNMPPPVADKRRLTPISKYFQDGSISLPRHLSQPFTVTCILLDIGGTLAKVAYYTRNVRTASYTADTESDRRAPSPFDESMTGDPQAGRLHFVKFETKQIDELIDFINDKLFCRNRLSTITATGGGAYKYVKYLEEKLQVTVVQEDEMACTVAGCNFLLRKISDEAFTYSNDDLPQYQFQRLGEDIFPYMLVNIGSGVSLIKVTGKEQFERIGGTSVGGGTFWGLCSLLTEARSFDEVLDLCARGHSQNVDMLVSDIYATEYEKMGLAGSVIASSFGKAMRSSAKGEQLDFREHDVAKSLLHMISNNIGQIAFLYAQLHGLKRIYFGGYFICNHPYTMHAISYAIRFWSKGEMKALFLRHEGYLGAVGAFVKHCGREERRHSWGENFAAPGYAWLNPVALDMKGTLVPFPHLRNIESYKPDTIDLNENAEQRDYWIDYFERNMDKNVARLERSAIGEPDAAERAAHYREKMTDILRILREMPNAFGVLSVRTLFDISAQCQREYGFICDAWAEIKREETETAMRSLPALLAKYETLPDEERHEAILTGILAGNIFDWGATEVARLMKSGELDFAGACARVPPRPWLIDNVDAWMDRWNGPPHHIAVVFVDNMGADLILGILPFVLELLAKNTTVILGANQDPVLNDVTHTELTEVMNDVSLIVPAIGVALREDKLKLMSTGMDTPCLDLSCVDAMFAQVCIAADLVVIEGMGRALHSNLYAQLNCDTLKIANIKSEMVARLLGGQIYDSIYKFEPAITQ